MTIPTPNTKYEKLLDASTEVRRKAFCSKKCLSIALVSLVLTPIFLLFFVNFYILYYNNSLNEDSFNRAQVYAIDEYLHANFVGKNNINLDTHDIQNLQPKLVCYYNYPNVWNRTIPVLLPEQVDCNLCTHINIAFATVKNHSIDLSDNLKIVLNKTDILRKCNKNLKLLLSIGGGGSSNGFPEMVTTHSTRKEFIKSIKYTLNKYKLDGVDLDWEFPGIKTTSSINDKNIRESLHKRERQHFSQLLREIRMEYNREKRDYILSVAVASPEYIVDSAYDVGEINQYVDFVNVMTYDFHFYTSYTPFTGFNAPLYRSKNDTLYLSLLNINYTAHMWIRKGMDRSKLIIGLPTYGHTFNLVNPDNSAPGSPASGFGQVGSLGFAEYTDICRFITNNKDVSIVFDNQTMSPYLHKGHEWISFENVESITYKSKFIKENKFGGAMVYSLNADDFSGSCQLSGKKFQLTRKINTIILDNDL